MLREVESSNAELCSVSLTTTTSVPHAGRCRPARPMSQHWVERSHTAAAAVEKVPDGLLRSYAPTISSTSTCWHSSGTTGRDSTLPVGRCLASHCSLIFGGKCAPKPESQRQSGPQLDIWVRSWWTLADSNYLHSGHALRVTGAQGLSRAGLAEHTIALLAR